MSVAVRNQMKLLVLYRSSQAVGLLEPGECQILNSAPERSDGGAHIFVAKNSLDTRFCGEARLGRLGYLSHHGRRGLGKLFSGFFFSGQPGGGQSLSIAGRPFGQSDLGRLQLGFNSGCYSRRHSHPQLSRQPRPQALIGKSQRWRRGWPN